MSNLHDNNLPISILPLMPNIKISFNDGIPANTVLTITDIDGINKALPVLSGRSPCDVRVDEHGKITFHPLNSASDDEAISTSSDQYSDTEENSLELCGSICSDEEDGF